MLGFPPHPLLLLENKTKKHLLIMNNDLDDIV